MFKIDVYMTEFPLLKLFLLTCAVQDFSRTFHHSYRAWKLFVTGDCLKVCFVAPSSICSSGALCYHENCPVRVILYNASVFVCCRAEFDRGFISVVSVIRSLHKLATAVHYNQKGQTPINQDNTESRRNN